MSKKNVKPIISFSNATFVKLKKYFSIVPKMDFSKFDEWFKFDYPISDEESTYFQKLIQKHFLFLRSYSEENLKMRFLAPIFLKVDFMEGGKVKDWYEAYFSAEFDHVILSGFADFAVAKGEKSLEVPYFFIQEFKPTKPDKDPEDQLLAEMIAALQINDKNVLWGGYIIGQLWFFVKLEKIAKHSYQYFVSKSFDSLDLQDLLQIYTNLQAIKHTYNKMFP